MVAPVTFSAIKINAIRKRAANAVSSEPSYAREDGWLDAGNEPMGILRACPVLSLKKGYELRGYRFVSGENGNGVVWAVPEHAQPPVSRA